MIEEFLETPLEEMSLSWLGLTQNQIDQVNEQALNPLLRRVREEVNNPGLREFYIMHDPKYMWFTARFLFNIDLLPIQTLCMQVLWNHSFPMFLGCRGFGKTFLLGLYCLMRAVLYPGTKVVVAGAAFRQSKLIFQYVEQVWYNSPVLRSIFRARNDGIRHNADRWIFTLGTSTITAIPIGIGGEKIRGLRANVIVADEFNSHDPNIYEEVIAGFGVVSSDPITNVKRAAHEDLMLSKGMKIEKEVENDTHNFVMQNNQSILSGTCGYDFEHFADYFKRYKAIIETRGDSNILKDLVGEESLERGFSHKDYAIIRIPYDMTPRGFLDDKVIARAKATMNSSIYDKEYRCIFVKDSDGFFKRTLIHRCTTSKANPIKIGRDHVYFDAMIVGNPTLEYVYGVDPASEHDNFSIVVLELHEDHTRVVYCWSTNRKDFKKRARDGMTLEEDYYKFGCRKLRDLMRVFPCSAIAIDSQGGGIAIQEAFHDSSSMQKGELAVWPVIDDKEKDTDFEKGLHILHMIAFSKIDWITEANHGLRKDMEDCSLLFPSLNPVLLGLAAESDRDREQVFTKTQKSKKLFVSYDTLEDCMIEIEELKNELSTIVMTKTTTGRDRWDTPEIKTGSSKKGRMKKDRYSALLIANMVARTIHRTAVPPAYQFVGGVVGHIKQPEDNKALYVGPHWWQPTTKTGIVGRSDEDGV